MNLFTIYALHREIKINKHYFLINTPPTPAITYLILYSFIHAQAVATDLIIHLFIHAQAVASTAPR